MNEQELQARDLEILHNERAKSGTAWTRNDSLKKNGYLVLKDLYDPDELFHTVPPKRGQYNYIDKDVNNFSFIERVTSKSSTSRYWHPQYRQAHTNIRHKLEKAIGPKLYNTYYYDRFYYEGQELVNTQIEMLVKSQ